MKNNKNSQYYFEEKKNDYFLIQATNIFKSHSMVSFTIFLMLLRSRQEIWLIHISGAKMHLYNASHVMNDSEQWYSVSFHLLWEKNSFHTMKLKMFY